MVSVDAKRKERRRKKNRLRQKTAVTTTDHTRGTQGFRFQANSKDKINVCLGLDFVVVVVVVYCMLYYSRALLVALPEENTAAPRAALPIPVSVCSISVCPDNGVAACV